MSSASRLFDDWDESETRLTKSGPQEIDFAQSSRQQAPPAAPENLPSGSPVAPLASPLEARRRLDKLINKREERVKRSRKLASQFEELNRYLAISDKVTTALEQLTEHLLQQLLSVVEEKLTIALQEILDQPITFKAQADFQRLGTNVNFWVERDGKEEDILRGQGGSVANILSVGLRMFALATLDPDRHRPFLVLDEQDCWLRPDLVPRLVKIVHQAARELGFQVIIISHHDVALFERYADKIFQFIPGPPGTVQVRELQSAAAMPDQGN